MAEAKRIIIGREEEKKKLTAILKSNKPEFVAVYGRRRVGKTYLIRHFFETREGNLYFRFSGKYRDIKTLEEGEQARKDDLRLFYEALLKTFVPQKDFLAGQELKTWGEAFNVLGKCIEECFLKGITEKIILHLDEVPWVGSQDNQFKEALSDFREGEYERWPGLKVFICGSAASWMLKELFNEGGSYHQRLTDSIHLVPFNLNETLQFFRYKELFFSKEAVYRIYMILGGVPKYLDDIRDAAGGADAAITQCVFGNPYMLNEYDNMFRSMFDGYQEHIKIVETIGTATAAKTRSQLLEASGLTEERFKEVIKELTSSSILLEVKPFKETGELVYKIYDFFVIFHLKWMKEIDKSGMTTDLAKFWTLHATEDKKTSWQGYVFESICFLHHKEIGVALGSTGKVTNVFHYDSKATQDRRGAQLDLVIEREKKDYFLLEIKFYNKVFAVEKDYRTKLVNKRNVLIQDHDLKEDHVQVLILASNGFRANDNSQGVVHHSLHSDEVFFA